ncbi:MAG: topoisomerase DNA-binding C4 zinc finger domain-containing protein, partial [Lachnospiraceae bacterium]|nr:topoisomerase DNA-binding C4 zinc finger domain-containing protein [Lachnospiraceae bacterium]
QNKCFIKESMCQDLTLRPYCGRIEYENAFYTYQGSEGICYYCDKNSQILKEEREEREKARQEKAASIQKADPKICPECGNRLVERNGSRGLFIGCTGFPRCRYTRSRW